MNFQDIFSQLLKVKIFCGKIHYLESNAYFRRTATVCPIETFIFDFDLGQVYSLEKPKLQVMFTPPPLQGTRYDPRVSNCNHAFLVPICITYAPDNIIGISVSGPQVPATSGSVSSSSSPIPPVVLLPTMTSSAAPPSVVVGGGGDESLQQPGAPSSGDLANLLLGQEENPPPGSENQSAAGVVVSPPVDQPITELNLPIDQPITELNLPSVSLPAITPPPSLIASSSTATTTTSTSATTATQFSLSPGSIYPCERPGYYREPANCRQFYTCKEVAPGRKHQKKNFFAYYKPTIHRKKKLVVFPFPHCKDKMLKI
jgi:hypothetical protein